MNLNEYLFKTSQSLMKRVLMYMNIDNNQKLLEIRNNSSISFNADDYEWAIISTLLLSTEKYLDGIEIEDYLTDKEIEQIELLLSESEEILPGDDSRQTQNCILDNDNNTVLTFDYLINGNITDFSTDIFLDELDGFGSYYEDDINKNLQKSEINEEKIIVQELKNLKQQIIHKQNDANMANDLIVSNGKLNTRNFVRWLRNALAHSHYVPYNEKQLRFFIKGKTSNHLNAIIDKEVVTSIISMIYDSIQKDFDAENIDRFKAFKIEIKEDLNNTLRWCEEQKQELEIFENYYSQLKNAKDISEVIKDLITKLNDDSYYYKKEEIINDIINCILNNNELTDEEKKTEILDYIEDIKQQIKEDNVLDYADFGWIYQCDSLSEFEEEITEYLIHNKNFMSEEEFLEILKIAKSNPNYNKNELFNKNKIEIILKIIEHKLLNVNEALKILSSISEIHNILKEKRINTTTYKILIMSLLKCSLLDGYNIDEEKGFEKINFSNLSIPRNIEEKLKISARSHLLEKLEKKRYELRKITNNILKNEQKLANKKIDNEYFSTILPQEIAKDKEEILNIEYEISQVMSDIDSLNTESYNKNILNQQIMRHLRNALAHGNVDIKIVKTDITKTIVTFEDIDKNNNLSFQCSIKLIDLLEIISSDEFNKTIFNIHNDKSRAK